MCALPLGRCVASLRSFFPLSKGGLGRDDGKSHLPCSRIGENPERTGRQPYPGMSGCSVGEGEGSDGSPGRKSAWRHGDRTCAQETVGARACKAEKALTGGICSRLAISAPATFLSLRWAFAVRKAWPHAPSDPIQSKLLSIRHSITPPYPLPLSFSYGPAYPNPLPDSSSHGEHSSPR